MNITISSAFNVLSKAVLENYVDALNERFETLSEQFSILPKRATEFSAGYDLSCVNDLVIPAHSAKSVTFGQCIEILVPDTVALIIPRSSLAKKRGLVQLFGPQYIYPSEVNRVISVEFFNFTDSDVELKTGDKLAQCVLIRNPFASEIGEVIPDPLDPNLMGYPLNGAVEFVKDSKPVDCIDRTEFYFQSPQEIWLDPGKVTCVMTGLMAKIEKDQVFILQNACVNPCVELANCVGIVDSDYYGNPDNQGEIGVLLLNRGIHAVKINLGDVIATGAIFAYDTMDDDSFGGQRVGGFGSTDK